MGQSKFYPGQSEFYPGQARVGPGVATPLHVPRIWCINLYYMRGRSQVFLFAHVAREALGGAVTRAQRSENTGLARRGTLFSFGAII